MISGTCPDCESGHFKQDVELDDDVRVDDIVVCPNDLCCSELIVVDLDGDEATLEVYDAPAEPW